MQCPFFLILRNFCNLSLLVKPFSTLGGVSYLLVQGMMLSSTITTWIPLYMVRRCIRVNAGNPNCTDILKCFLVKKKSVPRNVLANTLQPNFGAHIGQRQREAAMCLRVHFVGHTFFLTQKHFNSAVINLSLNRPDITSCKTDSPTLNGCMHQSFHWPRSNTRDPGTSQVNGVTETLCSAFRDNNPLSRMDTFPNIHSYNNFVLQMGWVLRAERRR